MTSHGVRGSVACSAAVVCVVLALLLGAPAPGHAAAPERPVAGASTCVDADRPVPSLAPARARKALRCLLAAHRRARRLPALRRSAKLRRIALDLARDMLVDGHRGHVSSEGENLDARARRHRVPRGGRRRWEIGEAIGWGSGDRSTPAMLMHTLVTSRPHRRLIESRRYEMADVGLAGRGDDAVAVIELAYVR